MTDAELLKAIQADPEAAALADKGDDAGCAARLSAALPPALREVQVTERGVYAAFANPADALTVMSVLAAVAAGDPKASPVVPPNPIVAAVLKWMEPSNGGVNLANATVRSMLDQFEATKLLTAGQVSTLKALAEVPATVDFNQISNPGVWGQFRPDGKVK